MEQKYVTIKEYAFMSGVGVAAIYQRILRKIISSEYKTNGEYYQHVIDIIKYPHCRLIPGIRGKFIVKDD